MTKEGAEAYKKAFRAELKIGQILLSQTSLTEEQLREALEHQKEKGGRLGEILVQKKYLSVRILCFYLSILNGCFITGISRRQKTNATQTAILIFT